MRPGSGNLLEKDRPIDPMSGKKFARKRARTGFEPLGIADGRQPFMPRVSHEPMPFDASLPFCPCDANAAAFPSGARERLSSSNGSLSDGSEEL
jgi:hypothetical protein